MSNQESVPKDEAVQPEEETVRGWIAEINADIKKTDEEINRYVEAHGRKGQRHEELSKILYGLVKLRREYEALLAGAKEKES